MKKKCFLLSISILFLSGCTNFLNTKNLNEEVTDKDINNNKLSSSVGETKLDQSDNVINSDNQYDSYSGEWAYWNNPENEADGGVSFKMTVKNNNLNGTFSAWSSNYGRLADSEISGHIQNDICSTSFSDDGRGHSGTILLTFGEEKIFADVTIQTHDSDFTFPAGNTVLRLKSIDNASESTLTEEPSNSYLNSVNSDMNVELGFPQESGKVSSVNITCGMNYEEVNNLLFSIGEKIKENPWEEYSNYTLINEKENDSIIKTKEDFYKSASLQKTLINTNMQYTLTFVGKNDSMILASILAKTSAIETDKNIKCGDNVDLLLNIYGDSYNFYETEKSNIYEYKTDSGYLRFIIDPQTNIISEWGIDIYSYQNHLIENKIIDSIFSKR